MTGASETSELERHYAGIGKATHQGQSHTANPEVVAKVVRDNSRAASAAGGTSGDPRSSSFSQERRYVEDEAEYGLGRSFSVAIEINPVASLLLAGALGYALGWMIHGRGGAMPSEALPDYARKRA